MKSSIFAAILVMALAPSSPQAQPAPATAPATSGAPLNLPRTPRQVQSHCEVYSLMRSQDIGNGGSVQELLRLELLRSCFDQHARTRTVPHLPSAEEIRARYRSGA